MLEDFMTIDILRTFTGLSMAVLLIVQFTKSIIKSRFKDYFVRIYALIIALILTFIFTDTVGGLEGIILNIINAILVTLASIGGYETIVDPLATKAKGNK